MTRKIRTFAPVAALVVALALGACEVDDNDPNGTDPTPGTTQPDLNTTIPGPLTTTTLAG